IPSVGSSSPLLSRACLPSRPPTQVAGRQNRRADGVGLTSCGKRAIFNVHTGDDFGTSAARGTPMTAKSQDGLKKKDFKRFRDILIEKKDGILKNAKRTLSEEMTLDSDDLPDEMDLASSEGLQSMTFRLRGREKTFLKKIDHALAKIDDG